MKVNPFFMSVFFGCSMTMLAQHSGNANHAGNHYNPTYVSPPINNATNYIATQTDEMVIVIKGIYNEKATAQIATFTILQLGKTADEATKLIDERIQDVKDQLKAYKPEIEIVTDMISFIPTYDYEVTKKVFNPKTYNEKPSGYELKKNLIIKFKETDDLNTIVAACAKNEIYDLAKVDYVSTNIDYIRDVLQKRALEEYQQTLTFYNSLINTDLHKKEKSIQDGFIIMYPMEAYKTYQAYAQAALKFDTNSNVNSIIKNTSQYYSSVPIKTQTFIINADLAEPSIQVFYELQIKIKMKEDQLPKNTIIRNNKYYLITPAGDIKPLQL